eukprot:365747-Chlamydomonas_euryale.AAC.13
MRVGACAWPRVLPRAWASAVPHVVTRAYPERGISGVWDRRRTPAFHFFVWGLERGPSSFLGGERQAPPPPLARPGRPDLRRSTLPASARVLARLPLIRLDHRRGLRLQQAAAEAAVSGFRERFRRRAPRPGAAQPTR